MIFACSNLLEYYFKKSVQVLVLNGVHKGLSKGTKWKSCFYFILEKQVWRNSDLVDGNCSRGMRIMHMSSRDVIFGEGERSSELLVRWLD